ncbi:hypothetical protein J4438_01775 [Candidatus Woesearchaeota archaeon]|nr:hypothetical protein [Candidatus Woesearchaeota archaeon]
MTLKEFYQSLNGEELEGSLLNSAIYSIISSIIVIIILYFILPNNFLNEYGFYLFFAILSYALIMPGIRQIKTYKNFACMSGMMIGMTFGMISGFLSGFFVGATNGMFTGAVFGIIIGIFIGIWMGLCCGVMGYLEGIMAGFMGGIMGAMTSVMMLNDHLKIFTSLTFIICAMMLFGLNYMIYNETRQMEKNKNEGQKIIVLLSVLFTLFTVLIMVYGPRSFLFGG